MNASYLATSLLATLTKGDQLHERHRRLVEDLLSITDRRLEALDECHFQTSCKLSSCQPDAGSLRRRVLLKGHLQHVITDTYTAHARRCTYAGSSDRVEVKWHELRFIALDFLRVTRQSRAAAGDILKELLLRLAHNSQDVFTVPWRRTSPPPPDLNTATDASTGTLCLPPSLGVPSAPSDSGSLQDVRSVLGTTVARSPSPTRSASSPIIYQGDGLVPQDRFKRSNTPGQSRRLRQVINIHCTT